MSKKDIKTQQIMHKIAEIESKRLEKALVIAAPLTIMLIATIAITLNITLTRLVEKDFFSLFTEFEYDIHKIPPQTLKILASLWDEVVEGVLALTIFSFIALVFLVSKFKLFSYPERFKQISKYKSSDTTVKGRIPATHAS